MPFTVVLTGDLSIGLRGISRLASLREQDMPPKRDDGGPQRVLSATVPVGGRDHGPVRASGARSDRGAVGQGCGWTGAPREKHVL